MNMTKKERKNYVVNRCYAAFYDQLPKPFKTVNALRYPGLWLSILMNPELFKLENLTPECTDVLVNAARPGEKPAYKADYENLDYTLSVFYELNYTLDKLRFIGGEIFAYDKLPALVKAAHRLPKIRQIELVSSGEVVPRGDAFDLLRNPRIRLLLNQNGSKTAEFRAALDAAEIDYDLFDEAGACAYQNSTQTVFVEGKVFRCPKAARAYALGETVGEENYVDIVARKLEIRALRLALFDFTNSAPPASCDECDKSEVVELKLEADS